MMIPPKDYIASLKDKSYLELIKCRDKLIQYLRDYEEKEMAGDRSDPEWLCHPSPEVRYQMSFEYLAELCQLMHERYNEEYVWGERTLKQDAETQG